MRLLRRSRILLVLATLACTAHLAGANAWAQDGLPPAAAGSAAAQDFSGQAGADLAFGRLGEDYFLTVYLAASFAISQLKIGLQVPLRLRVIDNEPEQDDIIRKEDWDEVSDYLRLIRYLQWSEPGDLFYGRIGELSGANIGHGTLMSNYLNVIDIDHFKLGLDTKVNFAFGGAEFVLDNLAGPEIFGGRVFLRPWSFVDADAYWTNWSVGTSLLTDIGAPKALEVDATTGQVRVDAQNNLRYSHDAVILWGLDTDFTVFENDWVSVTPYWDNNFLFGTETGYGLHLGAIADFTLPLDTNLQLRLEYQYLGAYYAPQYLDATYEIQRLVYPSPAAYGPDEVALTKQVVTAAKDQGAHGYLGQLAVSVLGMVRLSGLYRGSERPRDNDLLLQLLLPEIPRVKLGVVYAKAGFADASEAFDPDGAVLQAHARVNVWAFVDLLATFNRRWQVVSEEGPNYGEYESVDDWHFGVGASFGF